MKITLENAAAVLAVPDALTLATAREYSGLLYQRRVELQTTKDAIKHPNREDGVEDRWALTLATGTDKELEALEQEHDAIERDLDRTAAQYNQFQSMEGVCQRREAVAALPGQLSHLKAKASGVNKARAALEKAMGELDGAYQSTATTYNESDGGDVPPASRALVEQVIESAAGAAYTPTGPLYHAATNRENRIAEALHHAERQGLVEPAQDWRELSINGA